MIAKELKINDLVESNFKNERLQGLIKFIHLNKKLVRVRVIKNGRRCWHEWIRINDLKSVNKME